MDYRDLPRPLRPSPLQPPPLCIGIDLAGVPHRETGVAFLRAGRLEQLLTAAGDDEILALAAQARPGGIVAINAPLSLPRGRCCLEDDCPCRHDPGTRSREVERELLRMRVPVLATGLINVLARRGLRLAAALRQTGCAPLEVYPFATLRLLGLPTQGKRTQLGRRRIHQALQAAIPGLDHPQASEHQLDAVVCALTAHLWHQGQTRTVGAADEGLMIIPDTTLVSRVEVPPLRRAAEEGVMYSVEETPERSTTV